MNAIVTLQCECGETYPVSEEAQLVRTLGVAVECQSCRFELRTPHYKSRSVLLLREGRPSLCVWRGGLSFFETLQSAASDFYLDDGRCGDPECGGCS